ncbi:hypothetical protein N9W41_00545, partial [bacterium]|nr:hypothetical protein [bacterium]
KVYKDWHADATSLNAFLNRIPEDDPYRLERTLPIYVGGDFRYILGQQKGNVFGDNAGGAEIPEEMEQLTFPMAFDIGVRIRPVREKYSFVFETRFSRGPDKKDILDLFTASAVARSAYFIADDLAYNSWVMAGIYRPMFGHYTPDHTSLSQTITGFGQDMRYKAVGVGSAPNVPFINVHAIESISTTDNEKGIIANVGGRFVTLSASIKLSVFKTTKDFAVGPTIFPLNKSVVALSGGLMKGKNIFNFETTAFNIEPEANKINSGSVYTFEYKRRLKKEHYFMLNYALSNTATDGNKGDASEIMTGAKSFLYPGVEVEALYIKRFERIADLQLSGNEQNNERDTIQVQLHLFF